MSEPYLGQIIPVAFSFAPPGWLQCSGQLVSVADYAALFQLIGTAFGGDGQNNFDLPNLTGAVAVGAGVGPGSSAYVLGQTGGREQVTLSASQVGAHSHGMGATSNTGSTNVSGPTTLPGLSGEAPIPYSATAANAPMANTAVTPTGGSQPHENRQPVLCVNYIIATAGLYPQPS